MKSLLVAWMLLLTTQYALAAGSITVPMNDANSFSNPLYTASENNIDRTLLNAAAWKMGPWSVSTAIPGFLGPNYLYSAANSGVKSILTWNWSAPMEGFYDIYERHTAYENRSQKARFSIENYSDRSHQTVYVDQQSNGGTWVKLTTVYMSRPARITVTTSNDVVAGANGRSTAGGVVVANAIRFVHVTGQRYVVNSLENNYVNMTCPSGKTPNLVVGHYFDPRNPDNQCSFSSADVSGNNFLVGNYLCGDPSWGVRKSVKVEYQCK